MMDNVVIDAGDRLLAPTYELAVRTAKGANKTHLLMIVADGYPTDIYIVCNVTQMLSSGKPLVVNGKIHSKYALSYILDSGNIIEPITDTEGRVRTVFESIDF